MICPEGRIVRPSILDIRIYLARVVEYFDPRIRLDSGRPKQAAFLQYLNPSALEQHHCARPRVERIGFHGLLRVGYISPIESECARNMDRKHQGHDNDCATYSSHRSNPPQAHKHGTPLIKRCQIPGLRPPDFNPMVSNNYFLGEELSS